MLLLFTVILMTLPAAVLALHFIARLRCLNAPDTAGDGRRRAAVPAPSGPERYRPMLRLLSQDDLALVGKNSVLAAKLRRERIAIFRDYLRCITKDYGRLLGSIRELMVASTEDRPELAGALYKYQFSFAVAVCRIELSLQLYRMGVGTVDCSGLVLALDQLRARALVLTPVS